LQGTFSLVFLASILNAFTMPKGVDAGDREQRKEELMKMSLEDLLNLVVISEEAMLKAIEECKEKDEKLAEVDKNLKAFGQIRDARTLAQAMIRLSVTDYPKETLAEIVGGDQNMHDVVVIEEED
ncbi:hypothetical protein PMAYCL1PPCAC_03238, partial [Pristionchus mayeri]